MGSFSAAIEKGIVRSGHIGTWDSPVMLVPSATGVPVILHEFKEKSDNVGMFNDKRISPKSSDEIWGPYAEWDSKALNQIDFGDFRDLAQESSSPFNFHVTATRSIFSNCILSSKFLLDRIGKDKILEILGIIAEKDPERYYRLIDEKGLTYRLREIYKGIATYTSSSFKEVEFKLIDAPENAFQTFSELAQIQDNPGHKISRKVRLVLDSHFFIVLIGLLTSKNGKSYHLSGRYMHKYLLEGPDSYMHQIRNDRLFSLIKHVFGADKLDFVIYPSINLRLPRINQYNFDPNIWDPKHWLVKKL